MADPVSEASQRLTGLLGLPTETAERAVSETLDCLRFSVDEYVVLRHRELQQQGTANHEIFERIQAEVSRLRFRAPPLSARQIRRRVYG